jgi:hypothetical protein
MDGMCEQNTRIYVSLSATSGGDGLRHLALQ